VRDADGLQNAGDQRSSNRIRLLPVAQLLKSGTALIRKAPDDEHSRGRDDRMTFFS
jgi:hypothetical protein